jgi:hypothetical protein
MTQLSDRMAQCGRACRHHRREGLNVACAIGHPIEKIVIAANGGHRTGIAFMFPCRPGPECKAQCPNYDPKTDAEIAEEQAAMKNRMEALIKGLPAMGLIRATMVKGKVARDIFDCPWCGQPRALYVSCAIEYNNHLSAKCKECGEGFIE